MPFLKSAFSPALLMRNPHVQTSYPTLFRKIPGVRYTRERIATDDNDFLDLDWLCSGKTRLAILSHGLEGSSQAIYIRGMALALQQEGFDVLAWNFRGCSGVPNKSLAWYHSGKSEDLECVVRHAAKLSYAHMALIGFSVGGNITFKYLADADAEIPPEIKAAVTISVPVDLAGCADQMCRKCNLVYMKRFLLLLEEKVKQKKSSFPSLLDGSDISRMKTFHEFDSKYTAPLNGFQSAAEYWQKSSSLPLLPQIKIPVLLLSASDDTFLSQSCYPREFASKSSTFFFEESRFGGHVGFLSSPVQKRYYSEQRCIDFLKEQLGI